ncbi:hypothetical protein Ctob_015837 [Chrysochromulina tobinii]|uniref:Uncharacterized protein n=1 Tax=Chrysochromulina tobinii TaxID=1460289 RepID=A0A0M0JZW7_9EUKA|nr:hypothetical protein Ctob_015837 [Chrysochromulina tobinii]|eukprot:KOO31877.1 hypothetical protein Ctob_015837 [Chrysochromulina sp. CCMP291]
MLDEALERFERTRAKGQAGEGGVGGGGDSDDGDDSDEESTASEGEEQGGESSRLQKEARRKARLAGLRGYRRSLRAVAEQAMTGRPLAECHGSKASLRRAGDDAGALSSLMLPLHDKAEVSPIAAVPWAVTLWRDQPERVMLAATAHLHRWVVRAGVSKEGHVAAFAQRGVGAQAAAFDRRHRVLQPLFAQLRARGLEISVISGVGYPTPVFTLEGVEALASALSRVVLESDDAAGVSKNAATRGSITWRLPDGLRVRFSVRSELSFVVWAYPAQLAAQLPAEPLHPDYLSPAALVARSRVLTSAAVVGDVLQGAWGGRPFEAVQLDASTIALWPAKPRAGPRPAFVPLPAWLSAPRELALDAGILPPRVQLRRSPASAEAEGMAAWRASGAPDRGSR